LIKKIYLYIKDLDITSGGSTYSVLTLMEGLEQRGYELKLIVNRRKEKEVEVHYPIISLDTKLGEFTYPYKLRKIIKEEKPDIVISNLLTQNIALSRAKGFKRKHFDAKCIGVVRGASNYINFGQPTKIPYRYWIKRVYSNLDCIVAVSNSVKKDLIKTFFLEENKVKVIYNPFNIEKIRELSNEEIPKEYAPIFEKHRVIITVGRLSPQKRHDLLIKIFSNLKKKLPDIKLVIIGMCGVKEDFENEKKLKNLIKELKLENDVYFLGFQKNPFKYVKRAKLFVLTSQHEGLPRVVVESLAVETPVVAFKGEYVDTTEIFSKNYETLIDYLNTQKMEEKILQILTDNNLYEKLKKETLTFAKKFSIEKSVDNYITLMENLQKNKNC